MNNTYIVNNNKKNNTPYRHNKNNHRPTYNKGK